MKDNTRQRPPLWRLLFVPAAMAIVGGGAALADHMVNANEPVIISDDVTNQMTGVVSTTGGDGEGGTIDGTCAADGSSGVTITDWNKTKAKTSKTATTTTTTVCGVTPAAPEPDPAPVSKTVVSKTDTKK